MLILHILFNMDYLSVFFCFSFSRKPIWKYSLFFWLMLTMCMIFQTKLHLEWLKSFYRTLLNSTVLTNSTLKKEAIGLNQKKKRLSFFLYWHDKIDLYKANDKEKAQTINWSISMNSSCVFDVTQATGHCFIVSRIVFFSIIFIWRIYQLVNSIYILSIKSMYSSNFDHDITTIINIIIFFLFLFFIIYSFIIVINCNLFCISELFFNNMDNKTFNV